MTFNFSTSIPANYLGRIELISGPNSVNYSNYQYLIVKDERKDVSVYEIKYESHSVPFMEAAITEDLLLVGHEQNFYLYDLLAKHNIITLEMKGYFSHFYIHNQNFYIADARGLVRLNKRGDIIWTNSNLGIDGVLIERFMEKEIHGSGEWDPPGGWVDFKLDLETGERVK